MQRSIAATVSLAGLLAIVLVFAPASATPVTAAEADPVCGVAPTPDPDPPVYYAIDLVTTGKVSGARRAEGVGNVLFPNSPFGVLVSPEGSYVYDLDIRMENARLSEDEVLAAWVTTPNLDRIAPIGKLDDKLRVRGRVEWNKFLVVITKEPAAAELGETWTGPIVARGMSRSGYMHTMAGHGPFESEPCAVYGYN
ncbi:MAG: hypothetical protein HKN17_11565 [Rhodothermales bacterium]|nr:hypothetical protein [Rhodothermales bacterium]